MELSYLVSGTLGEVSAAHCTPMYCIKYVICMLRSTEDHNHALLGLQQVCHRRCRNTCTEL